MAITKQQRKSFWIDYACLVLNWTSLSILGFTSSAVVWAFIWKEFIGTKYEFWLLNDTKDGNWGDPKILADNGFALKENAPRFIKVYVAICGAIWWWFRNHSWNWIRAYLPEWKAGAVDKDKNGNDIFYIIKSTIKLSESYGRWTRADKYNQGVHYIAYQINGKIHCQFSFANRFLSLQLGAGGSEFRTRIKLYYKSPQSNEK